MQRLKRLVALGCGFVLAGFAGAQPCVPASQAWIRPYNQCASVEVWLPGISSTATAYRVFRKIGVDSAPQLVAEFVPPLPTRWNDTSAPAGAALYYQLEVWVNACVTRSSWEHTQRHAYTRAPFDFRVSDLTQCGQIELKWQRSYPCGTNTTLYRAEYPEFVAAVPIAVGLVDSYIDSAVETNTPYFYWAVNHSSLGDSATVGPFLGRASDIAPPGILPVYQRRRTAPTNHERVSLPCSVINGPSYDYQWYKEGVPLIDSDRIEGALTTELILVGCDLADAGTYQLQASNACGTSMSDPIVVEVAYGWCRPACPCDVNYDGAIDGRDMMMFLDLWTDSEPCADWNLDGGVDGTDLNEYMEGWYMCCC